MPPRCRPRPTPPCGSLAASHDEVEQHGYKFSLALHEEAPFGANDADSRARLRHGLDWAHARDRVGIEESERGFHVGSGMLAVNFEERARCTKITSQILRS